MRHAYSRKYSRFARLDATLRLGFKTPYFRNVTSKKDTQSFFTVPLPTSLRSVKKERVNVSYNIVDRRSTRGANEKARGDCLGLFVGVTGQNYNLVNLQNPDRILINFLPILPIVNLEPIGLS